MTIERRGNKEESIEAGIGRVPVVLGKRAWFELPPGSCTSDGSMKIVDEDTVQVREDIFRGSRTAWPIESVKTYRGAEINRLSGLRWLGDDSKVNPSVVEQSGPYMPPNFDDELARRDAEYVRRHRINRS